MQSTEEATHKLQKAIGRISNLPTPPLVFQQINKVINNPNTSAYDIAAILSEDPAMSVKVLKLSNSAFYGLRQEVTSIKQAVIIMGIGAIRSLVLSTAVFGMFKKNNIEPEFEEQFWRHSLATATSSKSLVRALSGQWIIESELAFSAGLLHDIGLLIVYSYLPDEFEAVREYQEKNEVVMYKAEQAVLGYTHADVGALLAQKWNLPQKLQEAIEYHHCPQFSPKESKHAYVTHVANYIAHITFDPEKSSELNETLLNEGVLEMLKLPREKLQLLKDELIEEYTKCETFMQMATGV